MLFLKQPKDYYLNEMHEKFGFFATWPVHEKLEVGDVGTIKNNEFRKCTTLRDLGIPFRKGIIGFEADVAYKTSEEIETFSKFGGNGIPPDLPFAKLNADVAIFIKKKNGVFFQSPRLEISGIENTNELGYKLIDRYKNNDKFPDDKKWDINWAVITKLQHTDRATVLISNRKEGYAALNAEAGAKPLDIMNLNCNFESKNCKGMETEIVAAKGLTPLFNIVMLKKHLITGTVTTKRSTGKTGSSGQKAAVREINYSLDKVKFQPYAEKPKTPGSAPKAKSRK